MGEFLSKFFIDPEEIPNNIFGAVQILFLFGAYSFILCKGANMISDGSELLLLVPKWAGLIGSIVLPFLGAVPDSAIVLFSGMGDEETVKEQISIGVGALAGSTILLITIPWALSIIAGRVSLNEKGEGNYSKPLDVKPEEFKKLLDKDKSSLSKSGINLEPIVKTNVKFIIFTFLTYLFIQATNLLPAKDHAWVSIIAYLSFAAMIIMIIYFVQQYKHSQSNIVSEARKEELLKKSIRNGLVNISGYLCNEIDAVLQKQGTKEPLLPNDFEERLRIFLRGFWLRYDQNKDNVLSITELRMLLRDLGEDMNEEEVKEIIQQFDTNHDSVLDFDEFNKFIRTLVEQRRNGQLTHVHIDPALQEMDEEEEEMPEDLCHLSPAEQQKRIIRRAFTMMFVGTAIVILFSDPIVDLLSNVGKRTGINGFYISFIVAPLISNLSEVIASYNYAAKKTVKASTISICTLQGSAIMNNAVCLGVFLLIIGMRNLSWTFTAETISVLVVELCIICISFKQVQTVWTAIFILLLYPLSLVIVAVLEHFGLN